MVRINGHKNAVLRGITFAGLIVCFAASNFLWAAGTTASNFLKIPAGARASGLGEAFTALADDASSIYWNPAGLSSVRSKEFTVSHNIWFQNITHSYVAFAMPLDMDTFPEPFAKNTLGFSITYLGMDDIERRSSNTLDPEGNFGASDLAVSLAFSRNMVKLYGRPLSVGATLKFIRQKIDSYTADAVAADLGVIYPFSMGSLPFRFGMTVQNFGTPVKFLDESYPLPLTFKTGVSFMPLAAYHLPLGLSLDVAFPNDSDAYWSLGTEYSAGQLLSLRVGYASRNDMNKDILMGTSFSKIDSNMSIFTGFMAGVGFNIPLSRGYSAVKNRMSLDYAFVPYGELGETHRISLGVKW